MPGILVKLTKMDPGDDPQAYLVTSEHVAIVVPWLPDHWAILLDPYLTGLAQAAYRVPDPENAQDYHKAKVAILDSFTMSLRKYCQREKYLLGACSWVMTQHFKDYYWC